MSKRFRGQAPRVDQIKADNLSQLATRFWAPNPPTPHQPYDPKVIENVYQQEINRKKSAVRRIMLLEFSQYLENYLWPNYNPAKASKSHVLSIAAMINEKFREAVPAWTACQAKPEHFPEFFRNVKELCLTEGESKVTMREKTLLLVFLMHCFNSLEVDLIREQIQRLVSLAMWVCLLPGRLEVELKTGPKYHKFWKSIKKKEAKADQVTKEEDNKANRFMSNLIKHFYGVLDLISDEGPVDIDAVHYCERFIELMIDLEAQLPTRRFFNAVMDDSHLVVRCRLSKLSRRTEGKLFVELLDRLMFYSGFEIKESTGEALTDHEMIDLHYDKLASVQRVAFKLFPDLKHFAMSNIGGIDTRKTLTAHFEKLSASDLHRFASHLHLLPPLSGDEDTTMLKEFLLELMVSRHERRIPQIQQLNETPLYPTEEILWDENVVPTEYFSGEGCLALPKLNLQFLTIHDYLLRNFNLFRLESTYEIRQNVEDAVSRLKPCKAEDDSTIFQGWARMAQPVSGFSVVEVAKPNIGENYPSSVRADVTVTLNVRPNIREEWESLRKHDVAFLITVRPQHRIGTRLNKSVHFIERVGIAYIRGCEIEGMLNNEGELIEEGPQVPKPAFDGETRTYRVWLDPNQYQIDMNRTADENAEDVYQSFNIIMRRKPKENNFKAVLETIRDLMNLQCVVPEWLQDTILGYKSAEATQYSRMKAIPCLDWNDTFLSIDHLRNSFPDYTVRVTTSNPSEQKPPFRVTYPEEPNIKKRQHDSEPTKDKKQELLVEPHVIPNRGPYPYNQPKKNSIAFTPTQIEAIRSGMQPGLTMVVGPPGTGKTDVAVQIISNIYHNFPGQRTLIVTHSNQALNQLFEKIMELDVDERHLLRLGHGEEALETEKDFSRYGRVSYVLSQRLALLKEVERLKESLEIVGDVAYTCETAGHFFLYQVVARWEKFLSKVCPKGLNTGQVEDIMEHFPFHKYFSNAPQPVFKGKTFQQDMDIAEGCYRHIKKIFEQLKEFRAFELLRSGRDRSTYLLIKEAKIIAMTCTHAALKRRDLVKVDFPYDNILMEESAQILEIETFIPLLLQNPRDGFNRLKRWIMIGDHHQLPPVIKNMAFQKFSNMEQSLFTRFVRLGVKTVQLDAQGRARPSIACLYNWRYKKLGNLPHIATLPEYSSANPGFHFDYQLVNVGDFNGVGESEPNPYFYQNLAEAEYVVAVFMYMRLQGYPAEKISILTTYNGQKHLIRDILNQRCAENPLIGLPSKVTTVDRFQGQQNDYILLSLVRTRVVGHVRDVRRLVVAMSRARLGLYVFARVALFQNCYELAPAFKLLMNRPMNLHLAPVETFPPRRPEAVRTPIVLENMWQQLTQRRLYSASPQVPMVGWDEAMEVGVPPPRPLLVIKDMAHMAQFVYDFYRDKVREIEANIGFQRRQQPMSLNRPPQRRANVRPPGETDDWAMDTGDGPSNQPLKEKTEETAAAKMPEHPGADSSDSEGEGEPVKVSTEQTDSNKMADTKKDEKREESGEQEDGKQESGKREDGKPVSGEPEDGKQESGEQEDGKPVSGEPEDGKQESGEQEDGKQESGEQEDGKQETAEQEDGKQETAKQAEDT